MKIGAVVVLYEPDEIVFSNIMQFSQHNIAVCIADNSEKSNESSIKTNYIHNQNFGGIAGALNRGCEYLFSSGCDFVFTFDQDSVLPSNFFISMEKFINENKADLVCPNFIDTNSKTYAAFIELTKWKYKVKKVIKTAFAISSGMGISSRCWNTVGSFNEKYIIDHVDTDYCLRAADNKIDIYVNYNICLEHQIGQRSVHKFLGVTFKPNNHNEIRKYFIVRNGTHLAFKYFIKYPSYFYMNILRVIHETLCVILYEKSKIKKLKFMAIGLFDSMVGHLGVYNNKK